MLKKVHPVERLPAFATFLLGKGYVVYGTGYDTNMQVICKMALKPNELDEMRGSKFVQSNLGTTFQHIRKQLQDGRKVLFTGTPCQISGLISYLGGKPIIYCVLISCVEVFHLQIFGRIM